MTQLKTYLFVLFSGLAALANGQSNFTFELITIEERSNFGDVRSLYQDRAGIIWMGVFGKGLAYYDGKKIIRQPLEGDGAFAFRRNIFTAGENILYLNYGHQVKCFDPVRQEVVDSIAGEEKKAHFDLLAFTKKGNEELLWATSPSEKGKNGFDSFHVFLSKNKAPFRQITEQPIPVSGEAAIHAKGENLIAKTIDGFVEINQNGMVVRQVKTPGLDLEAVFKSNSLVDEKGQFWFSFHREQDQAIPEHPYGLYCWETDSDSLVLIHPHAPLILAIQKVGSDIYLAGKQIYANKEKRGLVNLLYRFRPGKEMELINPLFRQEYDMGVLIFSIFDDANGNIWLGGSQGLGKLIPFSGVFHHTPLLAPRGITEDTDGNIYLGGITVSPNRFLPQSILRGNPEKGLPFTTFKIHYAEASQQEIYSLNFLDDHLYWSNIKYDIAADRYVFNEKWRPLPHLHLIDRKKRLWQIIWYDGVMEILDKDTKAVLHSIPIPALQKQATEMDVLYQRPSDGTVWLGTHGQGIFVFSEEGELLSHFFSGAKSKVQLIDNIVSTFYEDKKQQMWIGHGAGLSRLDTKTSEIEHFEIIPNKPWLNLVYGILPEEDDRFLWISTNQGLFRYDTEAHVVMDFPLSPIIGELEYNRTSFFKSKSGRMYFGGIGAVDYVVDFKSEEVVGFYENMSLNKAKVIINHFSKFDKNTAQPISQTTGLQTLNKITLNPGDRFFNLEFTISDYRSPENNYFSHYLEGYEKDWSEARRGNNQIRYENLPPGEYQLHLAGGLSPKNLQQNKRTILVKVFPPWWQTWWAYLAYILLIGSVIFYLYKFQLNRQLEKVEAKRLTELDSLKTRLYTNITHEFRTPLTVILGMNESIRGHEVEKKLIQRNANNLLRLINQLLDLSKLDAGGLKTKMIQGDIVAYLQYLTESFYSMATDKKVNLRFQSALREMVMDFDEEKIQHVLFNLLSNAIKFTKPGGKVWVEVDNTMDTLVIKIKDTGIGIPAENLPHIFDRFYQVETKSERGSTFAGTGIGLALTKELLELMDGEIEVKSKVGWGTEFSLTLPIHTNVSTPQADAWKEYKFSENHPAIDVESLPVSSDQITTDKPQVLVIEDNAGVVTYIKTLLQKDYHVQVAINGQEGIDLALELIPDLIITDVMMPAKNGFEVCEILKKDKRTSHIPIVMLTAKADLDSKIEGLETGADVYLSKPFEKKELLVRLRKLLELRTQLQAYYSGVKLTETLPQAPSPIEDEFIKKLLTLVEERLDDPELGVDDLSRTVFLSHAQMYRKLKALTGQTPSQFIRNIRLRKSMELLKNPELSISEIAYEVGFGSPNYFTRMFKKEFGMVPGEARQ